MWIKCESHESFSIICIYIFFLVNIHTCVYSSVKNKDAVDKNELIILQ